MTPQHSSAAIVEAHWPEKSQAMSDALLQEVFRYSIATVIDRAPLRLDVAVMLLERRLFHEGPWSHASTQNAASSSTRALARTRSPRTW